MKFFQEIIFTLCFLGLFQNNSFAAAGKNGPEIGDVPPPLTLSETIQGPSLNEISWDKLKGKVTVLEFWNTCCGPCVKAIPHWNELVESFKNKPVVFISISDDNGDYLKSFLKRKPIKGWVVLDGPLDLTQTAFGFQGWPYTVIVDASGKVAAITHPALLKSSNLEEILAGKPCSLPTSQLHSPAATNLVVATKPIPTKIEISIKGPFPKPDRGAFDSRGWETLESFPAFEAKKAYLTDVISAFFDISPKLVFVKTKFSDGLYDISAISPHDQLPELKQQFAEKLKTTFGIAIQTKKQNVKVYVMTMVSTNAPGLKQVHHNGGGGQRPGGFYLNGDEMAGIASFMENFLDRPVINETGLDGLWLVDVKWQMSKSELAFGSNPDPDKVIKAVREQLGLELKPTHRTLEALEVTKVKN